MKKCSHCQVSIQDETDICMLCKRKLKESRSTGYLLYPRISNIRKNNIVIKILVFVSMVLATTCVLVNRLIDPQLSWSMIAITGILYIWITTFYSIKSNVNIASHVLLQSICVFFLCFVIDEIFGFSRWSLNYALPIIIQVSNVTMLVLLIVTHKRYLKYIIYQLILSLLSAVPIIFLNLGLITSIFPVFISTIIAFITLIFTLILCGREFDAEIERRFHF